MHVLYQSLDYIDTQNAATVLRHFNKMFKIICQIKNKHLHL